MAIELVLDASVCLAWFLKETPERAAYAAAVGAVAAGGAILYVPLQWGIEMGHALLREHRRKVLKKLTFDRIGLPISSIPTVQCALRAFCSKPRSAPTNVVIIDDRELHEGPAWPSARTLQ